MLRPQSEAPRMGWRRALFQLSGGLINLGPGAAELRDRELIARVKAEVLFDDAIDDVGVATHRVLTVPSRSDCQ